MKLRLAIVCTHPIQYQVPLHRALSDRSDVTSKVFYTYSQAERGPLHDRGFGAEVQWDIDLLGGYDHEFVPNTARQPDLDTFSGIQTPTLVSQLREWRADCVLFYGWNHRAHLEAMRALRGHTRIAFRGDSTLLDAQPVWRRAVRRTVLGWVYGHVDTALSVGQNNSDYFRWCGLSEGQIRVVPHSVDVARFRDCDGRYERDACAWRASLGIPSDAVVIGFLGKLQAKKDPLLLLRAFSELDRGSHLVFFGSGELEAKLRAQAGETANIHFQPFQNQSRMPAAYRVCDLVVLPSRGPGETWGLALNEALACERPIVASSKVGGARDLIRNGENGLGFIAGDTSGLVHSLRALTGGGREALLAMGRAGAHASNDWSSDRAAVRMTEALQEFAA